MKNNKKGMSLIVLVITILVMIILAGVVIVSLSDNNPIGQANKAKTESGVSEVRSAIIQYAATALASEDVDAAMAKLIKAPTATAATDVNDVPDMGSAVYEELLADASTKKLLGVSLTPPSAKSYFAMDRATGNTVLVVTDAKTAKELGFKKGTTAQVSASGIYISTAVSTAIVD